MDDSNFEGICLRDDNIAKEYCCFVAEHGSFNRRAQLIKLVKYPSEEENILSLWLFCHGFSQEYNQYHSESGISVVQVLATFIL